MKPLAILCCLIVGTTIGRSALIPQSLVNGSFESGLDGWTQQGCVQSGPPYFRLPQKDGRHVLDLGGGDIPSAFIEQRITLTPNSNYWPPKPVAITFDFGAIGDLDRVAVLRVTILDQSGHPLVQRIFADRHPLSVAGGLVTMRPVVIGLVVPAVNKSITLRFEDLSAGGGEAVDPLIDNVRVLRF